MTTKYYLSLMISRQIEHRSSCRAINSCEKCQGWPLCLDDGRIIVRLGELDACCLKPGDFYFCVRPTNIFGAELILKYRRPVRPNEASKEDQLEASNSVIEHVITEDKYGQVFSSGIIMEGGTKADDAIVVVVSDEQMTSTLHHMLVSVEMEVQRMRWELQQTSHRWARAAPPEINVTSDKDKDGRPPTSVCSAASGVNECLMKKDVAATTTTSVCCCGLLHAVDLKDFGVQTSPIDEHKEVPTEASKLVGDVAGVADDEDIVKPCVEEKSVQSVEVVTTTTTTSAAFHKDVDEVDFVAVRKKSVKCPLPEVTSVVPAASVRDSGHWEPEPGPNNGSEDVDDGYHDNSIVRPGSIFEVNEDVLKSIITFIPGCRDRTGRVVIVVDLSVLRPEYGASKLAQLLLYYHTIPRKEAVGRGFLFLVDARNSAKEAVSLLDEIFYLLEGNVKGVVNTVVFWKAQLEGAVNSTDTLARKQAPVFPQSGVKVEVVHSIEEVQKVIRLDQLPVSLGGEYVYDHQKWVDFRKKLEPFMQTCRSVGRRLIAVMQGLKGADCPPSASGAAASKAVERHKRLVGHVFDDPQLVQLQQTGLETLNDLEEAKKLSPHNNDISEAVKRCSDLHGELQRAIGRLVRLADKQLRKLEQCLQLRTFEEETTQVLSWLSKKGEETLNKHRIVANSLGGVKAQERDFEKFYFLAMRHIEKGNDLLDEASALGHNESTDAEGMKELATSLKQHLGNFSARLEDQREKLEDTSKCYQILDKAYEWALEAMKFISRLKMDQYTSPEQLTCLVSHLRRYLEANPPLADQLFDEMVELATKLDNERLLEQCKVAQVRCRETAELICTRQQTLLKAKEQLESECLRQLKEQQQQLSASGRSTSPLGMCPTPSATSTPCYPYARRRSVSGLPNNLVTPPSSLVHHRRHESICANNIVFISEEQDENCADLTADVELSSKREASSVQTPPTDDEANDDVISKTKLMLMKRSQTWQFEDEVWDVSMLRSTYGLNGQLVKNAPTRGSAESIPSITENEEGGLSSRGSKLGGNYPPVPVNTHLHQRGSSLNLQFQATSMADLRPSDELLKQKKTVLLIMREMIQTERDYVNSLEYIIENYIPELLRDDIPQALRGKRNVIFGNIEKIHEFHSRYFLQELKQCETSPSQVGPSFLRYESHFYLYALYNKNKPKSDSLMAEYGSAFFKSKQLELGDKMDLASYLLKPVQRMGKYALLLKQLLKECSDNKEPDHAGLTAAKDMVNFQLRHGNDLLAMDAIRECDVNLKEQGCLLRQDEFLVWQGKSRKCLRHVFLFEELILFGKARRDPIKNGHDVYQYKSSMKMADIGLTEQLGDSNTKFEIWFRKRKLHDTHTLQAPNPEIRQAWIQEISKLLWKQALRNREMRLVEMSSMGIGNKPCLDIKPSQDQISDRSISISQLNKTPRFRNSIAVTSSAYLRNTNKRPHSIISVSSSSSGGSTSSSSSTTSSSCGGGGGGGGQSSTGAPNFYGALNLGFDPNDSPKSRHRSQCSSESGIITDLSLQYDSLTDCSGSSYKKVERSNSNTSNESIGIGSLPVSPEGPLEEDSGIGAEGQG